jgi:hypothetical protein
VLFPGLFEFGKAHEYMQADEYMHTRANINKSQLIPLSMYIKGVFGLAYFPGLFEFGKAHESTFSGL